PRPSTRSSAPASSGRSPLSAGRSTGWCHPTSSRPCTGASACWTTRSPLTAWPDQPAPETDPAPMDDNTSLPPNQDGAVDMLWLVDRLEEMVSLGKRVPFSTRVMVEEEEFLQLVDQLRVAVPNEIKQAQRVIK